MSTAELSGKNSAFSGALVAAEPSKWTRTPTRDSNNAGLLLHTAELQDNLLVAIDNYKSSWRQWSRERDSS